MTSSKKIGFFALQLIFAFFALSTIDYVFPRDFWLHALIGFHALLFLNVFFDFILKVAFDLDTSDQGNRYSEARNKIISSNYFWITALFFLSGLGSLMSGKPINDIILVGVPLLFVWGVLMFWGTPTRVLRNGK